MIKQTHEEECLSQRELGFWGGKKKDKSDGRRKIKEKSSKKCEISNSIFVHWKILK